MLEVNADAQTALHSDRRKAAEIAERAVPKLSLLIPLTETFMTDWSILEHAYGKAADVPLLLADLSPDPTANVWADLWSRICHQGTVYSASFAALPILADIAEGWKPADRCQVLVFAASILASDDVVGHRDDLLRPVASVIPRFQGLCLESLAAPNAPQNDFIYLLQAARAFNGDRVWGQLLDQLADGEFSGTCPLCGVELYMVIGKHGYFTTAEDWVRGPAKSRSIIAANPDAMHPVGEWMFQQAQKSGQVEVADRMRYVFGSSTCPSCSESFQVSDAITGDHAD
jgi:hypothetical protein